MPDEIDEDDEGGNNTVKTLRDQLKAKDKALTAAAAELEEFRATKRQSAIAKALSAKSAKPELAKFYPADGDTSDEALNTWLEENAELFGITPTTEVDPATRQNAQAISTATANAPATKIGSLAELNQHLATAPFEQLVQEGYITGDMGGPKGR